MKLRDGRWPTLSYSQRATNVSRASGATPPPTANGWWGLRNDGSQREGDFVRSSAGTGRPRIVLQ